MRMMGFLSAAMYDALMAPLEVRALRRLRRTLMRRACGEVLEIGAGTGANVPHYRCEHLNSLTLTDRTVAPNARQRHVADLPARGVAISRLAADVMKLPFPAARFDTVVGTLLFCSVDNPYLGLSEVRRVLRRGGIYLFIEHVRPHHATWRRAFESLNALWRTLSGGCNLNRDTVATMRAAGFEPQVLFADKPGVFVAGVARVAEDRRPVGERIGLMGLDRPQ